MSQVILTWKYSNWSSQRYFSLFMHFCSGNWHLLCQMWPYCITLMLNFWTSLSVYPAVVVLVTPQVDHPSFWTSKFFLPICCFFIFNLCDFLGRYLGRFGLLPREKASVLLVVAVLRVAFIPIFLLCNVHPRHLPVVFESQYYYIAFMIAFGLTNGYLVLNVFVNGPLSVPVAYRKLSGFFLMLFLGLGLTLGSFTSTLLVRILWAVATSHRLSAFGRTRIFFDWTRTDLSFIKIFTRFYILFIRLYIIDLWQVVVIAIYDFDCTLLCFVLAIYKILM